MAQFFEWVAWSAQRANRAVTATVCVCLRSDNENNETLKRIALHDEVWSLVAFFGDILLS